MARHGLIAQCIRRAIDEFHPDIVVSTHALPALVAAHARNAPCAYQITGVVGDFGAHAYWPDPAIDRYCVSCDEARDDLIRRGVEPDRIHVTGVPIRSNAAVDRDCTPDRRLKVLIVIGGRRAGPYRRAAGLIAAALPELDRRELPIELTIVTGANRSVHQQLQDRLSAVATPIELIGLADDLPARLAHADIIIGKPGGSLMAEVLASGAAYIALTPGPGQETANANFLRRHRAAVICNRPGELIETLTQVALDSKLLLRMQQAARACGRPNATNEAAQVVLNA